LENCKKNFKIINMKNIKNRKLLAKGIITWVFAILNALMLKLKIIPIIGTNNFFPAANGFGPSIGGIIGSKFGPIAIILSVLLKSNFKIQGGALLVLLRRLGLPMALASFYFGMINSNKKTRFLATLIPIMAIFAFFIHPIGREVWYFSLFWLIPIIVVFLPQKLKIPSMALGATFVDHAVGSVLYLYTMNIPAEAWISAIPQVMRERLSFGIGILLSYFILKTLLIQLDKLLSKFKIEIKEFFEVYETDF